MNVCASKIPLILSNLQTVCPQEVWLPGANGFLIFIVCNKEGTELNDFTKYRTEHWQQLPNNETEVRVGARPPTALPRAPGPGRRVGGVHGPPCGLLPASHAASHHLACRDSRGSEATLQCQGVHIPMNETKFMSSARSRYLSIPGNVIAKLCCVGGHERDQLLRAGLSVCRGVLGRAKCC